MERQRAPFQVRGEPHDAPQAILERALALRPAGRPAAAATAAALADFLHFVQLGFRGLLAGADPAAAAAAARADGLYRAALAADPGCFPALHG